MALPRTVMDCWWSGRSSKDIPSTQPRQVDHQVSGVTFSWATRSTQRLIMLVHTHVMFEAPTRLCNPLPHTGVAHQAVTNKLLFEDPLMWNFVSR